MGQLKILLLIFVISASLSSLSANDETGLNNECLEAIPKTNAISNLGKFQKEIKIKLQQDQKPIHQPSYMNIIAHGKTLLGKATDIFGSIITIGEENSLSDAITENDPTTVIKGTSAFLDELGIGFDMITWLPRIIIDNGIDITISPIWGSMSGEEREKLISDSILEQALENKDVKKYLVPEYDVCLSQNNNDKTKCNHTIIKIREIATEIAREYTPQIMPLHGKKTIVKITKLKLISKIIEKNIKMYNFPKRPLTTNEISATLQATNIVIKDYKICIKQDAGDCDQHLSSSIFFRIGKETLKLQLQKNLKCSVSTNTFNQTNKLALAHFDKCGINNYFSPRRETSKLKDKTSADTIKACIMSSIYIAAESAIKIEIKNKLKDNLGKFLENKQVKSILDNHMKTFYLCAYYAGIKTNPNIPYHTHLRNLSVISQSTFKDGVTRCTQDTIGEVAKNITQISIIHSPELKTILNNKQIGDVANQTYIHGYRPCMEIYNYKHPEKCQGYITSKASQFALNIVLEQELEKIDPSGNSGKEFNKQYNSCIDLKHRETLSSVMDSISDVIFIPECNISDVLICEKKEKCSPKKTNYSENQHVICIKKAITKGVFHLSGKIIDNKLDSMKSLKKYNYKLPTYSRKELQTSTQNCMGKLFKCNNDFIRSYSHDKKTECPPANDSLTNIKEKINLVKKICEIKITGDALKIIARDILKIEIDRNFNSSATDEIESKLQLAKQLPENQQKVSELEQQLENEKNKLTNKRNNILEQLIMALNIDLSMASTEKEIMDILPSLTASATIIIRNQLVDNALLDSFPTDVKKRDLIKTKFLTKTIDKQIRLAATRNDGTMDKIINNFKKKLTLYIASGKISTAISREMPSDKFGQQAQKQIFKAQKSFAKCWSQKNMTTAICSNIEVLNNSKEILKAKLDIEADNLSYKKVKGTNIKEKFKLLLSNTVNKISKLDKNLVKQTELNIYSQIRLCMNNIHTYLNSNVYNKMIDGCISLEIINFYAQISNLFINKFKRLPTVIKNKVIRNKQKLCILNIKRKLMGTNFLKYLNSNESMTIAIALNTTNSATALAQSEVNNCRKILEKDLKEVKGIGKIRSFFKKIW